MTNTDLQSQIRDALSDAEEAHPDCEHLQRLHKLLHKAQCRAKRAGLLPDTVSTRSGGTGGDKPEEP